jgi:hypothetical protein
MVSTKTLTSAARSAAWKWVAPRSRGAASSRAIALVRRDVHHGWVVKTATEQAVPDDWRERWTRAEPLFLRGAIRKRMAGFRRDIARTCALFEGVRRGASFDADVRERLLQRAAFELAGTTVEVADAREIEKVYVNAKTPKGRVRDLYAKLSWIAHDERDTSLRVRFSFGSERLGDWLGDPVRAVAADRYCEAVFPESALLADDRELFARLRELVGAPVRLSERIVYSNAPGGGAVFHHDAEPRQLGVAYAQLAGETGWLALSRHSLAEELAAAARGTRMARRAGTVEKALHCLENDESDALEQLLNANAAFTRRLVERRAFHRLRAGDVLLLPSHASGEAAWHSVFALGVRPSLALSFGVFAAPAGRSRRGASARRQPARA